MKDNNEKEALKKSNKLYILAVAMIFIEAICAIILIYQMADVLSKALFNGAAITLLLVVVAHYSLVILRESSRSVRSSLASISVSILLIAVFGFGISTILSLFKNWDKMNQGTSTPAEMELYVLRSSKFETSSDAKNMLIGYRGSIDEEITNEAMEGITSAAGQEPGSAEFSDFDSLAASLQSGDVDAILLKSSYLPLIEENFSGFTSSVRSLYSYNGSQKENPNANTGNIDISKSPFVFYLSGVDASNRLSDVNIVISVNPTTHQVLLTNIPRDYYVYLYGDRDKHDKLTHAGTYGINCSIETIEKLLSIDINYFVKVSFNSVVNIVDALGGIDVNSAKNFTSVWSLDKRITYKFTEGVNHLDGRAALAFARERKQFAEGDRMRGQNQEAVIRAIIQKILKPSVIGNIGPIMEAISMNTLTDIQLDQMLGLIRYQLTVHPNWNITSYNLDGTDASRPCYSSDVNAAVMIPDESTVNEAHDLILNIISGKQQEE